MEYFILGIAYLFLMVSVVICITILKMIEYVFSCLVNIVNKINKTIRRRKNGYI